MEIIKWKNVMCVDNGSFIWINPLAELVEVAFITLLHHVILHFDTSTSLTSSGLLRLSSAHRSASQQPQLSGRDLVADCISQCAAQGAETSFQMKEPWRFSN